MEDGDLYDEFGNYVGPEIEEDEMEEEESEKEEEMYDEEERMEEDVVSESHESMAVVLHEDKNYYPDASDVYPEAETMVEEEDHQAVEEPIIAPHTTKLYHAVERVVPDTSYDKQFLKDLLDTPQLIRNVSVVGNLHHGKTSVIDMLVEATHEVGVPLLPSQLLYTDTRTDERDRNISIKASPMTLALETLRSKTYAFNIMDTPGHTNFMDEITASLCISDGVVLVVDALEGCLSYLEEIIKHCLDEGMRMVLVINKIDRLILEMKLPPKDVYMKLRHVIGEVNKVIRSHSPDSEIFSPTANNVCFTAAKYGVMFTLKSFAHLYVSRYGLHGNMSPDRLAEKLFGNYYFSKEGSTFTREAEVDQETGEEASNSFITFILEPIFKIFATVLGEEPNAIQKVLSSLGISVKRKTLKMEVQPMLKMVLGAFFANAAESYADSVVHHVLSPSENAETKVRLCFKGAADSHMGRAIAACSSGDEGEAPLVVMVSKVFESADCRTLRAFGRVMSGRIEAGKEVRVLGERFDAATTDLEDVAEKNVSRIAIHESRYDLDLASAGPGTWILIEGIDETITDPTATVVGISMAFEDNSIFKPLRFETAALVKVAIEPRIPKELHQLVDAVRKVSATHPIFHVKVEDYGERDIYATGELYLDVVLYEIRTLFSNIEIKISDPFTCFAETIQESSVVPCTATTPNGKNKITFVAEPLEEGLERELTNRNAEFREMTNQERSRMLRETFKWDLLSSRSIWDVGPTDSVVSGTCLLVDFTLPAETDAELLAAVKMPIIQGFQFAAQEGPLCSEPIRRIKFKIVSVDVDADPLNRQWSQIIPTARKAAYASFLTGIPKLMEPICKVEVICSEDAVKGVYNILSRRRGHVIEDITKPGTQMYVLRGLIPMIDVFGFETDLRVHTFGKAYPFVWFDHWQEVRGDPLDRTVVIRPLEPAVGESLARDFLVKTRNRKGLDADIDISKYMDESSLLEYSNATK